MAVELRENKHMSYEKEAKNLLDRVTRPEWLGFYGSPDSTDEDWALVYLGDKIPPSVREGWGEIRSQVHREIDLIAVAVDASGNIVDFLGADPVWPHPVDDVQNCLHQTVTTLAEMVRYIPPAERDIVAKQAQCRAWMEHGEELLNLAVEATRGYYELYLSRPLRIWAKRAGFIGGQLMALQVGEDAGYTKASVDRWLKKSFATVTKMEWRPSAYFPEWDRSPDDWVAREVGRHKAFLGQLVDHREYLWAGVVLPVQWPKSYGSAPYSLELTHQWEPKPASFAPLRFTDKPLIEVGSCPLCRQVILPGEVYPTPGDDRAGMYYAFGMVHEVCAEKVRSNLEAVWPKEGVILDKNEDYAPIKFHLEFSPDGTPWIVAGEYYSSSRIEFIVLNAEGKLVARTSSR